MESIEEKRAQRLKFMRALYEVTDGDELARTSSRELGTNLELTLKQTELAVQYLVGEELVSDAAMGGVISITHGGVVEVEEALLNPFHATRHFPPVAGPGSPLGSGSFGDLSIGVDYGVDDVVAIEGDVPGSEGDRPWDSYGSDKETKSKVKVSKAKEPATSQATSVGIEAGESGLDALVVFLEQFRSEVGSLGLGSADLKEANAVLAMAERQAATDQPDPSILAASLDAIRGLLSSVGENPNAAGLLALLP